MTKPFAVGALCVFVGVVLAAEVSAQGRGGGAGGSSPVVTGAGVPGAVPVWTGATELGISPIEITGAGVEVSVPLIVTGNPEASAVVGSGTIGVSARGSTGVSANGTLGPGLSGVSSSGPGVRGIGSASVGVLGNSSGNFGVWGEGNTGGVLGKSLNGIGVRGESTENHGVMGTTATSFAAGVAGSNTEALVGGVGVHGFAQGRKGVGVSGNAVGEESFGVFGQSSFIGVLGISDAVTGVQGESSTGIAVLGISRGSATAGHFVGNVRVTQDLFVEREAFKPGGGSWSVLSDERAKKSIQPISGALRQLLELRGVLYEYKDPSAFHERPGVHMGVVAQEVENVFPSWVDIGLDGYRRVTFRGFEALAIEALREVNAQIARDAETAMTRIADLERQNAELRAAVAALAATVERLQR